MRNLEQIKSDFNRIKEMGFVKCTRENNKDGGIGNTYEDLLGVSENNLIEADYLGFEIKSKRLNNKSYTSLFSKSPSFPKGANSYLRETYGEVRDINHPEKKKLYASVFGHRDSKVYDKFLMKLDLDYNEERLYLRIKDLDANELDNVYWTFDSLKKASNKLKYLMLVLAETRNTDTGREFNYKEAEIYNEFNFENFLKCIETGLIMFDIRIGVHNSGKNEGKTHDHGSGFRIKKEDFPRLYKDFEILK